jgi:hypothetical protein
MYGIKTRLKQKIITADPEELFKCEGQYAADIDGKSTHSI